MARAPREIPLDSFLRPPHPSPFRTPDAMSMRGRARRQSTPQLSTHDSALLDPPALSPRRSPSTASLDASAPPPSLPRRSPGDSHDSAFDLAPPPPSSSASSASPPESPRINAHHSPNLPSPPNPIEIASFSHSTPAPSVAPTAAPTFPLTDSPLLYGQSDFIPALADSSHPHPPRDNHLLNLAQFTQRNEPMLSFEAGEPAEERRYYALAELLETERTYFQSLKVLVKVSLTHSMLYANTDAMPADLFSSSHNARLSFPRRNHPHSSQRRSRPRSPPTYRYRHRKHRLPDWLDCARAIERERELARERGNRQSHRPSRSRSLSS